MSTRYLGGMHVLIVLQALSSGCVMEMDADTPQDNAVEVNSVTQADEFLQLIVTCPGVPGCVFTQAQTSYRVRYDLPSPAAPGISSWLYYREATRVSGCGQNDRFCELDLRVNCAQTREVPGTSSRREVAVFVERFVANPWQHTSTWVGFIQIPTVGCLLQACTAPPSAVPALSIQSEYCRGRHTNVWTSVSDATYYQGQAKPMQDYALGIAPTTPWDVIPLGYMYPGIVIDTWDTQCQGDSSSSYYLRLRACNACGCTAWSWPQLFQYWKGACA